MISKNHENKALIFQYYKSIIILKIFFNSFLHFNAFMRSETQDHFEYSQHYINGVVHTY